MEPAGNDWSQKCQLATSFKLYLYMFGASTSELFESTGLNFPVNVQKSAEIQISFMILIPYKRLHNPF